MKGCRKGKKAVDVSAIFHGHLCDTDRGGRKGWGRVKGW